MPAQPSVIVGTAKYAQKSSTPVHALIWGLNDQKAFGTNYGLTAKVAKDVFHLTKGQPKEHAGGNGSGVTIYRHFCDTCGSFILEFGVGSPTFQ